MNTLKKLGNKQMDVKIFLQHVNSVAYFVESIKKFKSSFESFNETRKQFQNSTNNYDENYHLVECFDFKRLCKEDLVHFKDKITELLEYEQNLGSMFKGQVVDFSVYHQLLRLIKNELMNRLVEMSGMTARELFNEIESLR